MTGVLHPTQLTADYCALLITEYSILDTAQIYSLLKRYGNQEKQQRHALVQSLVHRRRARILHDADRNYLIRRPNLRPEGQYLAQIKCFWVLLDYIDQVDQHYATGTYSRISMEIKGRDYDLLYVEKGHERLCMNNMAQGAETRYIIIVEDMGQIPLIKGKRIHSFATVDERGTIRYYASS